MNATAISGGRPAFRGGRRLVAVAFLGLAAISSGRALGAQQLLGTGDLASLAAGPPDQRIQYGPGPFQFGNLRLPKRAGPHPLVIFVHGGCWLSAYDIAHAGSLEQAMADSGFAVWSLEYRRVGNDGGGWPGTFQDVAKGTDYVRELAPKYALDLSRVIVAGHSAGGQFALWVAARKKIPASSELYVANPLSVRGVFALAPAPDLEGLSAAGTCGNVIDKLMGGSPADHADRYAAASPMKLMPVGVPQTLIVGALDRSWAPIGRLYSARAREAGDSTVTLIEAPESGHFELVAPKTTTWPIVIRELKAMFVRLK
jgi:acetyl esterase/lipase